MRVFACTRIADMPAPAQVAKQVGHLVLLFPFIEGIAELFNEQMVDFLP